MDMALPLPEGITALDAIEPVRAAAVRPGCGRWRGAVLISARSIVVRATWSP